jgi:transcriptional regulator with XRE-family HTH domain
MSSEDRFSRNRVERTNALLGTIHRTVLEHAGEARTAALEESATQLERIADLLPGALDAGMSLAEVARLTGVSRPTLYELQRKGDGAVDRRLQLLASLAEGGAQTKAELAEGLGMEAKALQALIDAERRAGTIDQQGDGERTLFFHTEAIDEALADWATADRIEERTTKTLRVMVKLMRYTPEEQRQIERKIAAARADGKERLGLLEALKMGVESELRRATKSASAAPRHA